MSVGGVVEATSDPLADESERKALLAQRKALSDALKRLTQYPEWDIYSRELLAVEGRWVEALLAGNGDVHYCRGFIKGLREAWHLPQLTENSLPKT